MLTNKFWTPLALCSTTLLCSLALTACGGAEPEGDKGDAAPAPSLTGGKADSTDGILFKGSLEVGDEAALADTFDGDGAFHAYEIELAGGEPVTIEVSQKGSSRGLDTVLYLLGPRRSSGAYDTIIGFDDDEGWGLLSRLEDFTPEETGNYLAIVGTYDGSQSGNYRLRAVCDGGACIPGGNDPLADTCVFGESYHALFGSEAVAVTSSREIGITSAVTELERRQVLAAVATTYEEVTTYEEAVEIVDASVINQVHVWDASARRAFTAYEFGAGDNSYGAILDADGVGVRALIQDGDLYECDAFWGQERRACAQSADCAEGLRCQGVHDGQGACFDPRARDPEGLNDECQTTSDCGDPGLVCAGASIGGGFCNPAWMQRTFAGEPLTDIPDNTGEDAIVEFDTFGLATVHTDVVMDLWVSHPEPSQLRITLTNPSGTEVVVFDRDPDAREIYLEDVALRGFPGDEDANGTWELRAQDMVTGASGTIREFSLTVMSRWD